MTPDSRFDSVGEFKNEPHSERKFLRFLSMKIEFANTVKTDSKTDNHKQF